MGRLLALVAVLAAAAAVVGAAIGDSPEHGAGLRFERLGADATWTTVFRSPLVLEGLTSDAQGRLYTTLRNPAPDPCRAIRVSPANTDPVNGFETVGFVTQPCSPSGLAFGPDGQLYITGSGAGRDVIVRLAPDAATPPTAAVYATGVPQANGIAFDRFGNLWATDGSRGVGTVWEVAPGGGAGVEAFRVPSMRNDVGGLASGVGRTVSTNPTGTAQAIVANGIAFAENGEMLVADTARGAVWKVEMGSHGAVESREDCDTTYTADTLCLDDLLVQHPYLEGLDGITLDAAGNVWGAANERNAIVVVAHDGSAQEFFRNPVGADQLRNHGPLETPTSPVVTGHTFCVAQSDGNRRDNSPNTAGEVSSGGKISCANTHLELRRGLARSPSRIEPRHQGPDPWFFVPRDPHGLAAQLGYGRKRWRNAASVTRSPRATGSPSSRPSRTPSPPEQPRSSERRRSSSEAIRPRCATRPRCRSSGAPRSRSRRRRRPPTR